MRNFKNVLTIALIFMGATLFAQTKLTGKVVDENNMALPGADVVIKGTTKGTSTDFDGKFSLESQQTSGTLLVNFMGYVAKEIAFNGSKDLGTIQLTPSANTLDEIVIVGVADIAKDRQTPVAVSSMKAAEIIEKLGTQELPELLNATPSVYATKQGGGFGDSRINVRGFDQRNTAILINGMPVNDMENGWVYFSNWAGLSDVLSYTQIQRGLGSSKLAISSVGGTINYLTRTSEAKQGGAASFTYGNDNNMKGTISYNTGLLDSGLSASVLLAQTQGDGYVDGTAYKGNTYFIGIGYKINDKNNIMFTATGAPQWHHQRYSMPISTFLAKGDGIDPNIKYNNQWGYLDGEEFSWVRNFYHKPIASLNWDLKFNETANLSTVLYGSWGRGGGTGSIGGYSYYSKLADVGNTLKRKTFSASNFPYNTDGTYDFEGLVDFNKGLEPILFNYYDSNGVYRTQFTANGGDVKSSGNGFALRASMNSHNWYGIVSNFNKKLNDNLTFDFGIDLRTYKGIHYRILVDPLGATGYLDNTDINNPNRSVQTLYKADPSWNPFVNIKEQEKIAYNNDGNVNWLGAFTQLEYKLDKLSAFIQGGISRQGFRRVDYFLYTPENQKSDWKNMIGGNVKGGLNYNLTERHNVFANAGYYAKQPLFNAIFQGNTNNLSENLKTETIIGVEAGYGYRSERITLNVNLYRTLWEDRFQRSRFNINSVPHYTDFRGVNELHKGIEIESTYKPSDKLKFTVMGSIGDWTYQGDAVGTTYNENTEEVTASDVPLYLNGVRVGDAAQITANLGLEWKAFKNFKFNISQFYADKLYAEISADKFLTTGQKTLQLPSYSLTNAGVSYRFTLTDKMGLDFRFNVNNLWDHVYISESDTNNFVTSPADATWNGIKTNNNVNFGWGRTWNASVRFDF